MIRVQSSGAVNTYFYVLKGNLDRSMVEISPLHIYLGPRFVSWRAHHLPWKSSLYDADIKGSESLGVSHRRGQTPGTASGMRDQGPGLEHSTPKAGVTGSSPGGRAIKNQ
jgi:hypothetical protein